MEFGRGELPNDLNTFAQQQLASVPNNAAPAKETSVSDLTKEQAGLALLIIAAVKGSLDNERKRLEKIVAELRAQDAELRKQIQGLATQVRESQDRIQQFGLRVTSQEGRVALAEHESRDTLNVMRLITAPGSRARTEIQARFGDAWLESVNRAADDIDRERRDFIARERSGTT